MSAANVTPPPPARGGGNTVNLRPYQTTAVAEIEAAIAAGEHPLYVLPTGGGKTTCFTYIARNFPGRVCIVMHRRELIAQTCRALGETPHGVIQSGVRPRPHARIQVASIQTLVNRLNRYEFDLIIIDEAHHTTAASYQRVVAAYPKAAVMGVTATPCRTDGRGLRDAGFTKMILGPSVAELTAQGHLTPAMVYVDPKAVNLAGCRRIGGDYARGDLVRVMDKPKIYGDAVEHYSRFARHMPAIAFCVSIQAAQHMAEVFRAAGYRAASIEGSMKPQERQGLIEGLARGDLHVLTSCDLISEGVDVPVVACGIMLRPTLSDALWLQQVGRCLRPARGKTHAAILDHVGNSFRHGWPDTPRPWNLDGIPKKTQERETAETVRICAECFRGHSPAPVCPWCGYEYPAKPRVVEQVSGKLQLIDAAWAAVKPINPERGEEWQCETLEDFQRLGKERGYAPGWAWHRWNAKRRKTA